MKKTKKPSKPKQPELDAEQMGLLVEDFKNFLRVGRVEYEDWSGLPTQAKAALVKAAKELEVEGILKFIQATSGRQGMLKVAAEIDGGDSLVEEGLFDGIRSVLRKRGITG